MACYLIVDIDVHDPERYETYRHRVPEFIAKYGGEYLVRGGAVEVIEGTWQPKRLVLFRFADRQAIQEFFEDPAYDELRRLRQEVATCSIIAVDGVASSERG